MIQRVIDKKGTKTHVLLAADEAYAAYSGAVIASAMERANPDDKFHFHIFTSSMSAMSRAHFDLMSDTYGVAIDVEEFSSKELEAFPVTRHTVNAYLRLLAAERLEQIEQIVYLDSDVIVRDSLCTLAQIGTDDKPVAAALDAIVFIGGAEKGDPVAKEMTRPERYFNSGVLIINLDHWRRNDTCRKIQKAIKELGDGAFYSDQSAMNFTFDGDFKLLPLKWNLQVPLLNYHFWSWHGTEPISEAFANPGVVHFTTDRKPWKRGPKIPFAADFRRHLASTPWGPNILSPTSSQDFKVRLSEEWLSLQQRMRARKRILLGRRPALLSTEYSDSALPQKDHS